MLRFWKCANCDLYSCLEAAVCQECFNASPGKSPIDHILYRQKLLFDGYLKTEILNQLKTKIAPQDVINLCYQFYFVDIDKTSITEKDWYSKEYKQQLYSLAIKYCDDKEYYISFQLLKMLINTQYEELKIHANMEIAYICQLWMKPGNAEVIWKRVTNFIENASDPRVRHVTCHFYHYGELLQSQGRYQEAITQFEQGPTDSLFIARIATCYNQLQNYWIADKMFYKSIIVNPRNADIRQWFADALMSRNKYEEALKQYQFILEMIPNNTNYKYYKDRCCECYFKLKDYENNYGEIVFRKD